MFKTILIILAIFLIITGLAPAQKTAAPRAMVSNGRVGADQGYISPYPSYERSLRPIELSVGGQTFPPLSPPQAMAFAQAHMDDPRHYSPRNQLFVTRPGGTLLPPVPTFPAGSGEFTRVGIVYQKDGKRLPLFGRPAYGNAAGNRFDYYVVDDTLNANPLGLNEHNGLELVTDDVVSIMGYPGRFFVYIY